MDNIIDFFKNDIKGLIILAILTSIVGSLLYDSLKKLYKKIISYNEISKKKKLITNIFKYYSDGYTSGYAWKSSYHQVILVGKYIIQINTQIGIIIFSSIFFVAFLILIGQPFSWIIIIFFSFILTLQYRRLKELKRNYSLFMEQIYGDDFVENLEKNSIEYIKKSLNDKK